MPPTTPALSASPAAATPTPTATPAPTPTATPAPAHADTLRIGWDPWMVPAIRDAAGFFPLGAVPNIFVGSAVYSGLYRWDAKFNAVPDLADGRCQPLGDGRVIRCRLVETTFHDGTPLTADDVAYSYRLWGRPTGGFAGFSPTSLKEVRVVDSRTLDFVLSSVDPTFLTTVLPALPILPQHVVEAAYAEFVAGTKDLRAKDLTKLADTIDKETSRAPPVCSPRVDAVEALLAKIGFRLYREDFTDADGVFYACDYMGTAVGHIRQAAKAIDATGLDAVGAAYPLLSINRRPIGTGPYRLVSEDATRIHLEAWPGYHGGVAATRYLDFVPAKGDGSDLVDGTADIDQLAFPSFAYKATAASNGVRVATPVENGFFYVAFNVRPGRLFADVALRKALQLCVDLPRDVDAATAGAGIPVYGPMMPGTWAYNPDIPKLARDTAAARKLIEGAGWRLGADGVYARNGIRLAAQIPVRANVPGRPKMADLIALQARDCGMDLQSRPESFENILKMLGHYPHDIPGTRTPFDLYVGGWTATPDPGNGNLSAFLSSQVTDAKHPGADNFGGFADPVVDRLVAAAMSTYDQPGRASLYRQVQEELAAQLPYLFLWGDTSYDLVRAAVTTDAKPLDLTAPNWSWQPERMVVLQSGS